jgi:hypothetical protein
MPKPKRKIYMPDAYIGALLLPVLAIIAVIAGPWLFALIQWFKK